MRRGPRRRDTIALVEQIADLLDRDPDLSANRLVALTGARRKDVLRLTRLLRGRDRRFPISEKEPPWLSPEAVRALAAHVDSLAEDVGRLRRRIASAGLESESYLLGRIAASTETLDAILAPPAAAIYRANLRFGAEEDEALAAALADVDAHAARFARLLGKEAHRW